MRVRKRHAWSAVLIGLFVLPVLKPEGFPRLEGWGDAALSWPARSRAFNPNEWFAHGGSASDDSPRVRELQEILIAQRDEDFKFREEVAQQQALNQVLASVSLDRRPTARHANVLRAHDASPFRKSISIDRGASDGVREGLSVAQGKVLVGVVQCAQDHFSRVQLVTDPASRLEVAVLTQEGVRTVGYLKGGPNPERLRLRFAKGHDGLKVRIGDPVTTSNNDERIPEGLLVGVVAEVGDADGDGLLEVLVAPQIDLERSTTVIVLLPVR